MFNSSNWSPRWSPSQPERPRPTVDSATFHCTASGLTTVSVLIPNRIATQTWLYCHGQRSGLKTSVPNSSYPVSDSIQVTATPSTCLFSHWSGDASRTSNPLNVLLGSSITLQAVFAEMVTANHPTPLWWLASSASQASNPLSTRLAQTDCHSGDPTSQASITDPAVRLLLR